MPSDLKTPYSHLLPSSSEHHASSSSAAASDSSRSNSPAPLPADDAHYAYSTQLRRHEPESIVEFAAHHNPLGELKSVASAAFAPPPAARDADHHHPFAHTAAPLTPSARFATQSIAQTLSALGTSASSGLDASKVHAVRELAGANEFEVEAKEPTWKKFIVKFYEDPLILLLVASAAVSAVVGNYDDAASILMAIAIVVTVGFVQEQRSEKSLEALNKLVPHYCHLIRYELPPPTSRGEEQPP